MTRTMEKVKEIDKNWNKAEKSNGAGGVGFYWLSKNQKRRLERRKAKNVIKQS